MHFLLVHRAAQAHVEDAAMQAHQKFQLARTRFGAAHHAAVAARFTNQAREQALAQQHKKPIRNQAVTQA